jgi:hypothetical protein
LKPVTVEVGGPHTRKGALKAIGGSQSDNWNNALANQAVSTPTLTKQRWLGQRTTTVEALIGIRPKDELEGMLAAQLIAAHNAAAHAVRSAPICRACCKWAMGASDA